MKDKSITAVMAVTCLFVFAASLYAAKIPAGLRSPRDLERWLSNEFTYEWQMPTPWQSAAQTVQTKRGSCMDFAILSQTILAGMGIRCDIAVIKFTDLNIKHAICAWKDKKGYSFMSNNEYVQTEMQSLEQAVSRNFPDWEEIVFTDTSRRYGTIIRAGKYR